MEPSSFVDVSDESDSYVDLAPELPSNVVLDATETVTPFLLETHNLENMYVVPTVTVADILALLSRKEDADKNIFLRYCQLKHDPDKSYFQDEVQIYLNSWINLVRGLHQQIKQFGLYRDNYLYYQVLHVRPECLILEKIYFPKLNDEQYDRQRRTNWSGDYSNQRYPSKPSIRTR